MKVSELAAELKKQNKDIIDKAAELGIDARGATKNLSDDEATQIRTGFDSSAEKAAEEKKARMMPRRIAKADVEEAERAKAEAEAAEEAKRQREEEEAAKAAEKAIPQLKVAKQAAPEPKPGEAGRRKLGVVGSDKPQSGKPRHDGSGKGKHGESGRTKPGEPKKARPEAEKEPKKGEAADEAARRREDAAAAKAPVQPETAEGAKKEKAETPKPAPVLKVARKDTSSQDKPAGQPLRDGKKADQFSTGKPKDETKKPEKGGEKAAAPGDVKHEAKTDAKKEARPETKPGTKPGTKPETKPEAKGEAKPETKGGKPKAGATGEQKEETGDKKKGGKFKGAKDAESAQGAGAKKKSKIAKKAGKAEDFRGSKKNPIIDDGSLEKEKRKKHRSAKPAASDEGEPIIVPEGTYVVNVPITVAGFTEQVERTTSEVILALMKLGIMANINQNLDEETVELLAIELDVAVIVGKDEGEIIEEGLEDEPEDAEEDLEPRPPIITVMGHVDHGKTSLLDAIRKTNVTVGEAGGITQHIGASEVTAPSGEHIVFLDTPGHEAFTAMRARGAHVTDIAVLVVAADDGVMPQTIESISHAKAAGVPIIVAINKIDKEGANPDKVKQELADNGVLVEDWGGNVIAVEVSAKTGVGIENLFEMILLQAEVLELRANPKRRAAGTVIEARLDKSKGPLATLLVLKGTLKDKMSIVAGTTSAKIRIMTDFTGKTIRSAGPATAVEITGFAEVPQAGDEFNALDDDRLAREIAEKRRIRQREQVMAKSRGLSFESLFSRISVGEIKELNVIIKADVMGSVGAIAASLEQIDIEGVKVHIIHRGVGTVTESDVMLASTSNAVIVGFNVRPSTNVTSLAEREGVEIRLYRVIYDVIGEVEAALKGMLDPVYREVVLGKAAVRETFRLPSGAQVAGSYVTEGKIVRNMDLRLVRDGVVVYEGKMGSLRRFKDDVREVDRGYECGIGIEGYNDIKIGDELEVFRMEEIERE